MSVQIHITFMRHGRSRADDENVHEGRYDSPLTDTGRAQVRARGADFATQQLVFDQVIASPLLRAHECAAIIGAALGVPVETDADWMERDNGALAGLPFDVAEARYPTPAFRNPYEPYCSGESDWELHCRAARAIEKIIRRGPGSYLVVAHGGILGAALRGIIGAPLAVNSQGIFFGFGDTGYARFRYSPDKHAWVLLAFRAE